MRMRRVVDVIAFVVCAGVTGVWGIKDPEEKLFPFLLAAGVVFFIRLTVAGSRAVQDDDPDVTAQRLKALFYAQGLAATSGDPQRREGRHLPKVG